MGTGIVLLCIHRNLGYWFKKLIQKWTVLTLSVHCEPLNSTRMHSSRMRTPRMLSYSGVSLRGVSLTGTLLYRDPPGQRHPPDREPSDRDPPQRETLLDRDFPRTETPRQRPPETETPGQRPPPIEAPLGQRLRPPVDRQTPVKTQPSQTSFAGGKNGSAI